MKHQEKRFNFDKSKVSFCKEVEFAWWEEHVGLLRMKRVRKLAQYLGLAR